MEFRILDLSKVTEQELLDCLDQNIKTAQMRRREIDELSKVAAMEVSDLSDREEVSEILEQNEKEQNPYPKDEEFEDEVAYYYEGLQKLDRTNLEEKILETLPSKSNPNYEKIMQRLKAEVLKGIKELKVFALTENVSIEEMEEFKVEILTEQRKIAIMDVLLSSKEESKGEDEAQEAKAENNLIFVPTGYGTIRVLEEMSRIPEENYAGFCELFESIKNGTFKSVKRFVTFSGLAEVRGSSERVVFARVDKNSYAILTAFVKKYDTTLGYRTSLENVYSNYKKMEKSIKTNLQNPDFMALNRQYEEELFHRLSKEKEVPAVKRKDACNG